MNTNFMKLTCHKRNCVFCAKNVKKNIFTDYVRYQKNYVFVKKTSQLSSIESCITNAIYQKNAMNWVKHILSAIFRYAVSLYVTHFCDISILADNFAWWSRIKGWLIILYAIISYDQPLIVYALFLGLGDFTRILLSLSLSIPFTSLSLSPLYPFHFSHSLISPSLSISLLLPFFLSLSFSLAYLMDFFVLVKNVSSTFHKRNSVFTWLHPRFYLWTDFKFIWMLTL